MHLYHIHFLENYLCFSIDLLCNWTSIVFFTCVLHDFLMFSVLFDKILIIFYCISCVCLFFSRVCFIFLNVLNDVNFFLENVDFFLNFIEIIIFLDILKFNFLQKWPNLQVNSNLPCTFGHFWRKLNLFSKDSNPPNAIWYEISSPSFF